jgi:Penicillin-Binding Protein C-terminus Family
VASSGIQVAGEDNGESDIATPKLVMTSPAPNSVFALSPQIPLNLQRIDISARLGATDVPRQVRLLIDGETVATFANPPYRALWQLAIGDHTVQAVGIDANGQQVASTPVQFQVEPGH